MAECRWLFVCQSAPYSDGLAIAGLDAAMAAGAFGQHAAILFTGDGVEQLRAAAPSDPEHRDIQKTLAGLPLYDIEEIYVDSRDWTAAEGKHAALKIQALDPAGMAALIARQTHVVSF